MHISSADKKEKPWFLKALKTRRNPFFDKTVRKTGFIHMCDRYTIDETLCSCFQLSAYSLLSKFGISFRFERLNSFTAASKGSSNGNGV